MMAFYRLDLWSLPQHEINRIRLIQDYLKAMLLKNPINVEIDPTTPHVPTCATAYYVLQNGLVAREVHVTNTQTDETLVFSSRASAPLSEAQMTRLQNGYTLLYAIED